MNLNKAFILGNVTRDPELRSLPSGQQVVSFGMATNRFYTDSTGQKKQEAEFHNIVAFGKLADISSKYLAKGSLVLIEGRIKTSSWQGNDGIKKFKTEIIAESLQLGPRGQRGDGTGLYQKPQINNPASEQKNEDIPVIEENAPVSFTTEEKSDQIDVKDIPF